MRVELLLIEARAGHYPKAAEAEQIPGEHGHMAGAALIVAEDRAAVAVRRDQRIAAVDLGVRALGRIFRAADRERAAVVPLMQKPPVEPGAVELLRGKRCAGSHRSERPGVPVAD
ncbi:MAG: hypothetical protein ACP5PN_09335 [Steroidobacteraceae bacterium]